MEVSVPHMDSPSPNAQLYYPSIPSLSDIQFVGQPQTINQEVESSNSPPPLYPIVEPDSPQSSNLIQPVSQFQPAPFPPQQFQPVPFQPQQFPPQQFQPQQFQSQQFQPQQFSNQQFPFQQVQAPFSQVIQTRPKLFSFSQSFIETNFFSFQTCFYSFLSIDSNGDFKFSPQINDNAIFQLVPNSQSYVHLKGSNGKYFSSDANGNVSCKSDTLSQNETWIIESIPCGYCSVSLKNFYGKYLSVQANGAFQAGSLTITPQEVFIFAQHSPQIPPDDLIVSFAQSKQDKASDSKSEDKLEGKGKFFESCHHKYFSAQKNGSFQWDRKKVKDWEQFEVRQVYGNLYILKTYHGKYVSAQENGKLTSKSSPSQTEIFQIVKCGNGYSIQTSFGKYLSAQSNGKVEANRSSALQWETFQIDTFKKDDDSVGIGTIIGGVAIAALCVASAIFDESSSSVPAASNSHLPLSYKNSLNGRRTFKSFHHKFLSVSPDGVIECNRTNASTWETFELERFDDLYSIKCSNGKYLSVDCNGQLYAGKPYVSSSEKFKIVKNGSGYSIQTYYQRYLSAQPNGTIEANRNVVREWEIFSIN